VAESVQADVESGEKGQDAPADDAVLAALAKAIAHPTRVRILRLLANRSTCVCGDLVEELPYAQSTVSEHLRILKAVGLVRGEVDPPRVCYCIEPAALALLSELVDALCSIVPAAEGGSAETGCSCPPHNVNEKVDKPWRGES
jgi:ArsR family transcriptional regulator, arsenate/arsenite/antimonite-responsive transcriptional repressor